MGHTKRTYDRFGDDLVRPLYGYVTELKEGHVPDWVKKQVMTQETRVANLLDIEYDSYGDEISRSRLPSGVSKERSNGGFGGPKRTKYVFTPEAWLKYYRERSSFDRVSNRVLFELRRDNNHGWGRTTGATLPEDISERLNAISETGRWDEYYHHRTREDFRQWYLRYQLGSRGGIQSVHIVADSHH
jgi:hypothetical protein